MKALDASHLKNLEDEAVANAMVHSLFMSVLGAAAWTCLTRADTCIYIQALQRRAHKPRIKDCRRLNVVIKFMKRHKVAIYYGKVKKPWRITGFSDAAFKAQSEDSSGLCIRGLAVLLTSDRLES